MKAEEVFTEAGAIGIDGVGLIGVATSHNGMLHVRIGGVHYLPSTLTGNWTRLVPEP